MPDAPRNNPSSTPPTPEEQVNPETQGVLNQLEDVTKNAASKTAEEINKALEAVAAKKDELKNASQEVLDGVKIQIDDLRKQIQESPKFAEVQEKLNQVSATIESLRDTFGRRIRELLTATQEAGKTGWGLVMQKGMELLGYLGRKWENFLNTMAFSDFSDSVFGQMIGLNTMIRPELKSLASALKNEGFTGLLEANKDDPNTKGTMADLQRIWADKFRPSDTRKDGISLDLFFGKIAQQARKNMTPSRDQTLVGYGDLVKAANELPAIPNSPAPPAPAPVGAPPAGPAGSPPAAPPSAPNTPSTAPVLNETAPNKFEVTFKGITYPVSVESDGSVKIKDKVWNLFLLKSDGIADNMAITTGSGKYRIEIEQVKKTASGGLSISRKSLLPEAPTEISSDDLTKMMVAVEKNEKFPFKTAKNNRELSFETVS